MSTSSIQMFLGLGATPNIVYRFGWAMTEIMSHMEALKELSEGWAEQAPRDSQISETTTQGDRRDLLQDIARRKKEMMNHFIQGTKRADFSP
ncbi:hypothetical protein ACJX0J_005840, partial [Zea mays]